MCFLAAREGRIVGADTAFHFGGEYVFDGDIITARFSSTRFSENDVMSIWGGHEGQTLTLKGTFHPREMLLSGAFVGERDGATQVTLRKIVDWSAPGRSA